MAGSSINPKKSKQYADSAGDPSQTADCSQLYNVQVALILHDVKDGTERPAAFVDYRLVNKESGQILTEGKTDEDGLTERIHTKTKIQVNIVLLKLYAKTVQLRGDTVYYADSAPLSADTCTTFPEKQLHVHEVLIKRGRIYFDFRYVNPIKDSGRSFIRAADTAKRENFMLGKDGFGTNPHQRNQWMSFEFTTEYDFKRKWALLYSIQKDLGMLIEQGHIFSHATGEGLEYAGGQTDLIYGSSGSFAMTAERIRGEDGTLKCDEIPNLEKLDWSKSSRLWLYGCRTGGEVPGVDYNKEIIADCFFANQPSLKEVRGEKGSSFFSRSNKNHGWILPGYNTVYLLSFDRGPNAFAAKTQATGKRIPPYIRSR